MVLSWARASTGSKRAGEAKLRFRALIGRMGDPNQSPIVLDHVAMMYPKVVARFRLVRVVVLCVILSACERAVAPVRTTAARPVYGDFAFDFDSVTVPDTVAVGDSIPVRFWA